MAGLGEELPEDQQEGKTPFAPRCIKDQVEEGVFAHRRDLFTDLQLVFFDTTSIDFEGEGGQEIGQRGFSKDHRPDLYQMVVGAVLDGQGRPICCELWPGNTTDVTTLIPVVDRLRGRFGVGRVCIVADRGMISRETIEALERDERGWQYILGARMRSQNEVRDEVLSRAGRYRVVHPPRIKSDDPSPLKVKEVWVGEHRYVVCLNEDEARKEAADREAIVAALREQLRSGDKSLVGNKGYRRYLSGGDSPGFGIDEAKLAEDARYDGKWVLRTDTELDAAEVALQYKQLWMVEHWFRSCKSLLQTRPISHRCDETIRGHVFCSFLALVLRQELQARLEERGHDLEWADVIQDLDRLQAVEVEQDGKRFLLRSEAQGTCGKVFQTAGVALPPTVQQVSPTTPGEDAAHSATPPH
jgi:transposase